MEHQPFSVAISVYKNDNPEFFDRALESITDLQTIKPDEVVLVVDGPVPNEINDVIDKYASKYVFNVIRLEVNGGLGNALKLATENAKYGLIARMDSDDVSVSNRFEQQLNYISNNKNVDVVGGNISEFQNSEANIICNRVVPTHDDEIKKYIKKRCPFNHMTVMMRKDKLFEAGGYLDWHYNEDYYLWIRMFLHDCTFANTGTTLVNVRTSVDMYSRRGGWKYFRSEKNLQKFMYKNKIIGFFTYLSNVFARFVVQCLMTNSVRQWFFKKYARKR